MSYFWHNIGKPEYPSDWAKLWSSLRKHGVITAGYGNLPNGKGRTVVARYNPGDIIIAYANRWGALGYGIARGAHTAELRSDPRNGSNHRHEAKVDWRAVLELDQAISPASVNQRFGLRHPRQTSERIGNQAGAELVQAIEKAAG